MSGLPSIYDLSLAPLGAWDFSRPLFVQAGRAETFSELVTVLHERLGLPADRSTLLTNAAYEPPAWWTGRHLVNPAPRLSAATADLVRAHPAPPFSVVAATTLAHNLAMRFHSNVAAFCHALEPLPSLMVTAVGQFAASRAFFGVADRRVRGEAFVGNSLIGQDEAEALFDAVTARPAGLVVEMGRFSGGTTVLLALAARASGAPGVVSVDVEHLPAVEYFAAVNRVADTVRFVDGSSLEVAARWTRLQASPGISMLFIDADHAYDAVARDLAAWLPHVVPGGIVALHDASTPDCGVAKAVYRHLAGRQEFHAFRQVGSTVLCARTPVGVGLALAL